MTSEDKRISLSGTVTDGEGNVQKTNYFAFLELDPEDYSDVVFSAEQARTLKRRLTHISTGSAAAIPLACGGEARCPFKETCPVILMDREARREDPDAKPVTPVGRPCLVEVSLMKEWTRRYLEQFDVEPTNAVDFGYCQELAELELMLRRLNLNLAKVRNAELVQDVVVGVDREGNPLTRQDTNSFFEAQQRLAARKSKVIRYMEGDREAQTRSAHMAADPLEVGMAG